MLHEVVGLVKSSASCTLHRALHGIILAFRVLQMKASIDMSDKGTTNLLNMNIFIVDYFFDLVSKVYFL